MLKKGLLNLGLCFLMLVISFQLGTAQETQEPDKEMMEAYMKMMAPNENHAFLENFAGEWDVETTAWMQPGAEPVKSKNSASAEMIFGGRFLKVDFKGNMFGQPFDGLQIIGYDNQKKKYISFWMDSTSTSFYLTEGMRDEKNNVITDHGLWPDPMSGTDMKVRTVTKLIDMFEYKFEMFMGLPDGSEFKSMENLSTRKK